MKKVYLKRSLVARIKNVLRNDSYLKELTEKILEKEIGRRIQFFFEKLGPEEMIKKIVDKLKKDAGITDQYICSIAYQEIKSQISKLVSNSDNEKIIQDLLRDES